MTFEKEVENNGPIGKMKPKRCHCNCEAFLITSLVVLALLLIACIIMLLLFSKGGLTTDDGICHNKGCTTTALALLSGMDWSVDPCSDFYAYTCSDFIRKSSLIYEDESVSVVQNFQEDYEDQLKSLFEDNDLKDQPAVMSTVQEMYKICVKSSNESKEEFSLFKEFLYNVLDGWPAQFGNDWIAKKTDFGEHLGNAMSYYFDTGFIDVYLDEDSENPSKYQVQIELGPVTRPSNAKEESVFKAKDEAMKQQKRNRRMLLKFLNNFIKLFGDERNEFDLEDHRKLYELDRYMDKLHMYTRELNDTEKMTINALNAMTEDKIDWLKLLNNKFDTIHIFKGNDVVNVHSLETIKKIPEILDEYPRRILENALVWNVIFPEMILNAGNEALAIYNEYKSDIDENFQPYDRQSLCQKWIIKVFPDVITRKFVDKYIHKDSKSTVEKMVQFIQDAYHENIKADQWMAEETRTDSLEKIKEMLKFVAYDEAILSNEELDKKYSEITVMPNHFSNFIEMNQHLNKEEMGVFVQQVDKSRFLPEFYRREFVELNTDSLSKGLWISSRVLQKPFFDQNRLASINFGTLGTIIAKEMAIELETEGEFFPYLGHYEVFAENDTEGILNDRSRCLIEQYNDFCIEDPKDNETNHCLYPYYIYQDILTDNLALKISYEAYQMWVKEHGEEQRLVEMVEFLPEQLFFLSYGNLRCEYLTSDQELSSFKSNSPTGNVRVTGSLSNCEAFKQVFSCQDDDKSDENDMCILQ